MPVDYAWCVMHMRRVSYAQIMMSLR